MQIATGTSAGAELAGADSPHSSASEDRRRLVCRWHREADGHLICTWEHAGYPSTALMPANRTTIRTDIETNVIPLRPREIAVRNPRLLLPLPDRGAICPLEPESGIQAIWRWIVGAGL